MSTNTFKPHRHYSPAICWMMDAWDDADPWGSAMAMGWALGEAAAALGDDEVTRTLDISWGVGGAPTLDDIREAADEDYSGDVQFQTVCLIEGHDAGEVTIDDIRFAARVISQYLDLCKAAGLDY